MSLKPFDEFNNPTGRYIVFCSNGIIGSPIPTFGDSWVMIGQHTHYHINPIQEFMKVFN